MTNIFDKFLVKYAAITCTGRRVVILPFTSKTEAMVISSGKDKYTQLDMGKNVCKAHVHAGTTDNHSPIANYDSEVLSDEETDMLFLARYYSFEFKDIHFEHQCPDCKSKHEEIAEISEFKRRLMECGSDSCPCKQINKDMDDYDEELEGPFNSIDWMHDRWSDVSEHHLMESPPELVCTPKSFGNLSITMKHLTVADKDKISRKLLKSTTGAINLQLLCSVSSIVWSDHDISTFNTMEIQKLLTQMPLELRQTLRSFMEDRASGIDTSINIQCQSIVCGAISEEQIGLNKDFFLPLRSKQ